MNALAPVNLSKMSDDTLRRWQAYWMRRLYQRGGMWLAAGMDAIASKELAKVEAELTRRGLDIEDPHEPKPAA